MKIEKLETFLISHFLVIRITTDDGTEGVGESSYWAFPKATKETIESLAPNLVGMDPGDTEHIWNYLHRKHSFRGNSLSAAISAIDIALWDIKGKRLGVPVWDLIGGKARSKVRAMSLSVSGDTPDEVAEQAKKVKNDGFTALKFIPMPDKWWLESYPNVILQSLNMVEAVRETVGWDFDIAIEIHRNMSPHESVVFIEKAAKYLPYFVEDPIAPDGLLAMSEVSEKIKVPLAVGERNVGIWEFRDFAQLTKPHFLKPDVGLAGGIGHVKKIAAVAESQHIRIAPHNFLSPIVTAACIQLGISTPNWDILEALDETKAPRNSIVKSPIPIIDGYYSLPELPGIGVEFDEKTASLLPFDPLGQPTPIRTDGSVALR